MNEQNELNPRWCLVGNIVEDHEYGEEHEIKHGTKQFSPGAKVYMAPPAWGDGYEKIIVIGKPRNSKRYIEVIMRSEYIENLRMQVVYKPQILRMMNDSDYSWWEDGEYHRKESLTRMLMSFPAERRAERFR